MPSVRLLSITDGGGTVAPLTGDIADGETLLVFAHRDVGADETTPTISGSGWTQHFYDAQSSWDEMRITAWSRVANNEPSTYSVDLGSGSDGTVYMVAVSPDAGESLTVTGGVTGKSTTGTAMEIPSQVAGNPALLFGYFVLNSFQNSGYTIAEPASFTMLADDHVSNGWHPSDLGYELVSDGSTGVRQATSSAEAGGWIAGGLLVEITGGEPVPGEEETYANDFEGGTDGVAITPANSGAGGDPFFLVAQVAEYSTTRAAHGSVSALLDQGEFSGRLRWETVDWTLGYWRAYVWFDSIATNRILQANTLGAHSVAVELDGDGTFRIRDATGVLRWTSATTSAGQWVRIEAELDASAQELTFRFFNNPESTTPTEEITQAVQFSDGPIDVMDFTSSVPVWFDDVALSDTAWIGPVGADDGGGDNGGGGGEPIIEGLAWTQAEIDSIPTSGTGWSAFNSMTSSDAGTPDLTDQNSDVSWRVMLQALRWRIDGGGVGRSAVISKLLQFPGDEDVDSLGVFRQMANVAVGADLIGMDIDSETVTNAEGSSRTYREWLVEMMTKTVGDHGRWFSIRNTAVGYSGARASYSNYGAFARAAYVALAFYVGTQSQQDEAVASLRQMLGTDQGQDGFEPTSLWRADWTDGGSFPNSSGNRFGINPADAASNIRGAAYEDAARQGSGPPIVAGGEGVSYELENWEGNMFAAVIAAHNGYPDIYDEADTALKRLLDHLVDGGIDLGNPSDTRYDYREIPWIANSVYGTNYTENGPAYDGRHFVHGDLLARSTWPLGVTAPAEPNEYVETSLDVTASFGTEAFDATPDEIPPEILDVGLVVSVEATADYTTGGGGGAGQSLSDDFNRASLGADWESAASDSWTIEGNALANETGFTQATKHATDADTDEHYSEFEIGQWASEANFGPWAGPAVMMPEWVSGSLSSQGDFYCMLLARMPVSELTIRRKENLASSQTAMGATESITAAPGDRFRLEVEGTDLVGYKNDVEVIRRAMSLAPLTVGGRGMGALATQNVGIRFDNWLGGDVGAGEGEPITEYDELGLDVAASFGIEAVDTYHPKLPDEYEDLDLDVGVQTTTSATDIRRVSEVAATTVAFSIAATDERILLPEVVDLVVPFITEGTDERTLLPQITDVSIAIEIEVADAKKVPPEIVELDITFTIEPVGFDQQMVERPEAVVPISVTADDEHDIATQFADATITIEATSVDSREMQPQVVDVTATLIATATDAREMLPEEGAVEVGFSTSATDALFVPGEAGMEMAFTVEAVDDAQFTEFPEAAASVEVTGVDVARMAEAPAAAVAFGIESTDEIAAIELTDVGVSLDVTATLADAMVLDVAASFGIEAADGLTETEEVSVGVGFAMDTVDARHMTEVAETSIAVSTEAVDARRLSEETDVAATFSTEAQIVGALLEVGAVALAVDVTATEDLTLGEVTDVAVAIGLEASDEAWWTENVDAAVVVGVEADGLLRGQERPETQIEVALATDSTHAGAEEPDLAASFGIEAADTLDAGEVVEVSIGTVAEAVTLADWIEMAEVAVDFEVATAVGVGATEITDVDVSVGTTAAAAASLVDRPEVGATFDLAMSEVHWQVERPTVEVAVTVETVGTGAIVERVNVDVQMSADLVAVFWPFYVPEIVDVTSRPAVLQDVVPRTPVLHDVKPETRG